MQAVRQQDGALTLLLNTKKSDSIKAAEKYSEMRNAEEEGDLERHICMDLCHRRWLRGTSRRCLREKANSNNRSQALPCPEFVAISDEEEYFHKKN